MYYFFVSYIIYLIGDLMKITKLSLYNNDKVVIENYSNIKDINDDLIIIDNYLIIGNNLKIKQIEEYFIIIIGLIDLIKIECVKK